jgi:hypothetical protein
MEAEKATKRAQLSLGWKVMIALGVLTAVEFWAASLVFGPLPYPAPLFLFEPITWLSIWVSRNPVPYLGVIAILKGVLILYYFMHVTRLWQPGHSPARGSGR